MFVGVRLVDANALRRGPFTDVGLIVRNRIPVGETQLPIEPLGHGTGHEIRTMSAIGRETVSESRLARRRQKFGGPFLHVMKEGFAVGGNIDHFVAAAVVDEHGRMLRTEREQHRAAIAQEVERLIRDGLAHLFAAGIQRFAFTVENRAGYWAQA